MAIRTNRITFKNTKKETLCQKQHKPPSRFINPVELSGCARSKMDANDYKSYLLGMVFYKYLSDKMLFFVAETMEEETESLEEALAVYRKYYEG